MRIRAPQFNLACAGGRTVDYMARILVIEDNEKVLWTYKRMLELDGHDVIGASNGNEGTRLYREEPTDVVITDMVMPEKDGM